MQVDSRTKTWRSIEILKREKVESGDVADGITEEELTRERIKLRNEDLKSLNEALKRLGVDPPKEEALVLSHEDKKSLILSQAFRPSECLSVSIPERPFIFRGLLPAGVVGELNGAGGVSKSMLALTLACTASAGRSWGSFEVDRPHRVCCWCNEDDQGELMRRGKTVSENLNFTAEEMALLDENLVILPARGIVGAAMCQIHHGYKMTPDGEVMRDLLIEAKPELIIIDT